MTSIRPLNLTGRLLLLLILITAASIPAMAASSGQADLPVLGTNWVFSDFDGDHKPDFAEFHGSTLNLKLSTGNHQHLSALSRTDGPEAEIIVLDIDGDSDLDIVLRSRFLERPTNVWLNNGRGAFTEAAIPPDHLPVEQPDLKQVHSAVPDFAIPIRSSNLKAVLTAASFITPSSSDPKVTASGELHYVQHHRKRSRLRAPPIASFA